MAVDDGGFIFVADSGNNRIQIFNPDGTFLRAFGRWGQSDGEFKVTKVLLFEINNDITMVSTGKVKGRIERKIMAV